MRGTAIFFSTMISAASLLFAASVGAQEYPGFVPGFDASHPLITTAPGTSVQLPTFSFFTISTTVNVPDSGGAFMGGINSAGSASRTNGGPGFSNRAGGSGLNGGGVSVTAQIHDLREMDRQLLAEAAAERKYQAAQLWAARVERAKVSTAGRPTISVAEARQARATGNIR